MNILEYILIGIVASFALWYAVLNLYRVFFLSKKKKHREEQARNIRFLQVQIPKNAVARSSDIDAKDHIQSMKQNIELMNQVYKNFYAIFDDSWINKHYWNNYISMEIIVEKEVIKFYLWVPKEHLVTVEKMISSFYIGAIVEQVKQPKLLEAWKFYAGWNFTLTKDSVHPIKTYEAFEADPMDSILSAFSNISKEEKVGIQILVEPLHEDWLKKMRKKADDIKEWKNIKGIKDIISKIWNAWEKAEKEKEREQEKRKHNFSQQQLADFDKKMDDELFQVKMRTIAISPTRNRPKKIIDDIARLFNQYNYIGLNTIKFKKAENLKKFAKNYVLRLFYSDNELLDDLKNFKKTTVLNIK